MNSVNAVLSGNGVLNAFVGSSQMVLLGAVSVLFSIAIVLIPFIASRLVRGEVGSTVFALVSAASFTPAAAKKTFLAPVVLPHKPRPAGPPQAMSDPGPPTGSGPGAGGSPRAGAATECAWWSTGRIKTPDASKTADAAVRSAGSAGEIGAAGAVLAV